MVKRWLSGVAVLALFVGSGLLGASSASGASGMPSGQRMYGNTTFDATSGHFVGGGGTIEPAYDGDTTPGTLIYLQTPNNTPVHPANHIDPATGSPRNVAPIYLPVYPVGSGIDPASLNCAHVDAVTHVVADNCPDHGPLVAGGAAQIEPSVYTDSITHANTVIGHDHLVGVAKTGGDFNVLWVPTLVLFTSVDASKTHITSIAQIKALEAMTPPQAFEVPLPPLTFHCSVVSVAGYNHATPAPVAGP